MWQAQETIYTTGSYDNPGFLWEVVSIDKAGEPLAVIAENMGEKHARLVAAAPDMLRALEMVSRIWSGDQTANIDPKSPLAIVRAALAKAGAK